MVVVLTPLPLPCHSYASHIQLTSHQVQDSLLTIQVCCMLLSTCGTIQTDAQPILILPLWHLCTSLDTAPTTQLTSQSLCHTRWSCLCNSHAHHPHYHQSNCHDPAGQTLDLLPRCKLLLAHGCVCGADNAASALPQQCAQQMQPLCHCRKTLWWGHGCC